MSRITARLERLEAQQPPRPFKAALSFIWTGPHNDVALEAARQRAETASIDFITIHLVPPSGHDEDPGNTTGLQHHG